MDLSTAEGKLRAVNFLLPYIQRSPNRLLRSEWAGQIAVSYTHLDVYKRQVEFRRRGFRRRGQ